VSEKKKMKIRKGICVHSVFLGYEASQNFNPKKKNEISYFFFARLLVSVRSHTKIHKKKENMKECYHTQC
jgi:hypothetical protein